MKLKVYLAGPITGLTYEGATDWRQAVVDWLKDYDIVGVDPMRGKNYLRDGGPLDDAYPQHVMSTQKAIVTRDRFDIMNCDLVMMNLLGAKNISIGTMAELGWADAYRKPIVLVMEPEGNPHDHAFVREIAGWRVEDLIVATAVVIAVLG